MGRLSAYSYTLSRVIRQEKKAVITRILLLYCHFLTERCYGVSLPVFFYRACFAAGYVTQWMLSVSCQSAVHQARTSNLFLHNGDHTQARQASLCAYSAERSLILHYLPSAVTETWWDYLTSSIVARKVRKRVNEGGGGGGIGRLFISWLLSSQNHLAPRVTFNLSKKYVSVSSWLSVHLSQSLVIFLFLFLDKHNGRNGKHKSVRLCANIYNVGK